MQDGSFGLLVLLFFVLALLAIKIFSIWHKHKKIEYRYLKKQQLIKSFTDEAIKKASREKISGLESFYYKARILGPIHLTDEKDPVLHLWYHELRETLSLNREEDVDFIKYRD